VDVAVEALDRQGLLRDISEVFSKEKINVIGVQTHSVKGMAFMTFTVETPDAALISRVLTALKHVKGVRNARRR
jgi:GTP pyrophosphokinase